MNGDVDFYSGIIKTWMDRTFEFRYKYLEAAQEAMALREGVGELRRELSEAKERMANIIGTGEQCDRQIAMSHRLLEAQRDSLLELCQRLVRWDDDVNGTGEELSDIYDDMRKRVEEINRENEPWDS